MSNLRDIFDMACPNCGNANDLEITITASAKLTADGTELFGDHHWDDESVCHCPRCETEGRVRAFKPPPPDIANKLLRLALGALNQSERFKIPGARLDSYQLAGLIQAYLNNTKEIA